MRRIIKNKDFPKTLFFLSLVLIFRCSYSQNPFIENKGQMPYNVNSKVNLPSGALFIEDNKFIYTFYDNLQLQHNHDDVSEKSKVDAHAYAVSFLNASNSSDHIFFEESSFYENYFIGESDSWCKNVKSYKRYKQEEIYPGINLLMFTQQDNLKIELHLKPNASPKVIKLKYEGMDSLYIKKGRLYCKTSVNTVIEKAPYSYQIIDNQEIQVPCFYYLENNILQFNFPQGYNTSYDLIIDPTLEFSTYSGSTADNFGYTATYDEFGSLFSGGTVFQMGYPTTLGAYDITYNNNLGGTDIGITKYNTTGTQRIYSTYLGGSKDELPHSMIVNSSNELFVFGTTGSADFPVTTEAYQTNFKGGPSLSTNLGVGFESGTDIFISRLSANGGDLLASTFIGGEGNDGLNTSNKLKFNYADEVRGEIDIDKNNNIFIATSTWSADFPIINGFQNILNGNQEGCIVKMDNQLTSIIWSSFLGGNADDAIYSLALDNEDNIYVTGGTTSSDFPVSFDAYQTVYQDSVLADAFVTRIHSSGNQILSSTYYGSAYYDQSYFVELGKNNRVYLFGQTKSSSSNLVYNANYYINNGGQFIAILSEDLTTLIRSTVLGTGKGTPDISPTAFLVDVCEKIYLAGWGSNLGGPLSTINLPITLSNAFQTNTDGNDFYLMVIDDQMTDLLYATYFGGSQSNEHVDGGTSRFDKQGIIYQSVCAGCGGNSDFPIEPNPGVVSATNNSINCNNGVFKFNFDFPIAIANFSAPFVGCELTIDFQNLSIFPSSASYQWSFGDSSTSFTQNPTHTYSSPGQYEVSLIVSDPSSCNIADTITKNIYILSNSLDTLQHIVKCKDEVKQIGLLPVNDPSVDYQWSPATFLSSPTVSNPFCNVASSTDYQLLISSENCTDTLIQSVNTIDVEVQLTADTFYCSSPIQLNADYDTSFQTSIIWSSNNNFLDTLSNNKNLTINSIGVYYVQVKKGDCVYSDSVKVSSPSINIALFSNEICFGDTAVVGVINQNPIVPIIDYNWSGLNFNNSTITDVPQNSRWYVVEVVNIDGCTLTDSIYVDVYTNPNIDSLWVETNPVFAGEEVTVFIQTNFFINWVDANYIENPTQINDYPVEDTCYLVEVYNDNNCIVFDSVCVEVVDIFCDEDSILIPTAFTPDNDPLKINETYFIKDRTGVVTSFRLEIFNRLGQRVFYSNNINKAWDGRFKGKKLPSQVLDFYLQIKCKGNKELFKKGNITLIR